MKLDVIFSFTFLYVQVLGSFYGQLRGAMSNVERGFGKLLNDVVFDIKDTFHCTMSAVEQVLAKNGLLDERSNYSNRCRGFAKPKILPKTRDYRPDNYFERRFKYSHPRHLASESELEHISQDLEKSIFNVNNSINDILRRREANSNFKVISELLKDETHRINTVTQLLERELENTSKNVRNDIGKLHIGHKKPSDTIWEDIKALHDLKSKSNNKTEINEITNIIDRVLNELHVTSSKKELSETEKLEEIKNQLNKYSSEKQNDQNAVLNTKEIVQNQITAEKEIKTFKDLAQSISNDKKVIADSNIGQVFKREATSQSFNKEKSLFGVDMAAIDRSSPFYNPNPETDHKKIVEEAKNIIEESKKSEELLNSLFNDKQQSNLDVFSNANIFNFGYN